MSGFTEDWVLSVFKNDPDIKVDEVLGTHVEPPCKKGDSCGGRMMRVRAEVKLSNGNRCSKTFVVKRCPEGDNTVKWVQNGGLFKTEIKVFSQIVPEMEKLILEKDEDKEDEEVMWPRYYHHLPFSEIVLEDLKGCGYQLASRHQGLDFEHAILCVKNLAKFHALSAVLIENGRIDTSDFDTFILTCYPDIVEKYLVPTMRLLSDLILKHWGDDWKKLGVKLAMTVPTIGEKLQELWKRDDSRLSVINHGDCWVNNMMFKYKDIAGKYLPISLRFVDFQLSHYNSYAFDLQYLMATSLNREVRRCNYYDLLGIYSASLTEYCQRYGFSGSTPTYEDVLVEVDRLDFFGLVAGSTTLAVVLAPPDAAVDFEALARTQEPTNSVINDKVLKAEPFTVNMKEMLLHYYERGVF